MRARQYKVQQYNDARFSSITCCTRVGLRESNPRFPYYNVYVNREHHPDYARNTPGSICQYKKYGLVWTPPSLFMSMRRPMHHWHVMPKVSTQVYMLDGKIWKLFRPRGNGRKRDKTWSSVQHPFLWFFAIHVSFIVPLPMMWILLTKPMQKSVTTVCLHCSFARLKNKHIGVLGTNVATISWLHWSPVSGYTSWWTPLYNPPIECQCQATDSHKH